MKDKDATETATDAARARMRPRKLRIPQGLDDKVAEYMQANFRSDMNDTYLHLIREGARAVGMFNTDKTTAARRQ